MTTATLPQVDRAPGFQLGRDFSLRATFAGLLVSGPSGSFHVPVPASLSNILGVLDCKQIMPEMAPEGSDGLWSALQQLARLGVLERVVRAPDGPLVEVEPAGEHYNLRSAVRSAREIRVCLSRFSYMRSDGSKTILESPLCHSRARVMKPELACVLAGLSQAKRLGTILDRTPELDRASLEAALALLLAEGFIGVATESGEAATDVSTTLQQWEFHDLLFHSRVRFGRHGNPVGGTYRFRGRIHPLPAIKPRMTDVAIPLSRPDLEVVAAHDLSLTAAIERRRSVRQYGDVAITLAELAEFLYRTARVRGTNNVDGVDLTSRPYPNGGASYELEIYLIADRCDGLLPGLFHYDPGSHQLEPLSPSNEVTEKFLSDAFAFSGRSTRPEILILVAARFQRVSWKYASIAYATTLKNVGALYQTMYLVATSMGLGPCALGSGDSDRFSELLGEDYYTETLVGEFMLGKPASGQNG